MAVAKMTHVRLVGLRKSESKIIDGLIARGLFEPRATDEVSFKLERGEATLFRELKLKQSKLSFGIDFIKQRHEAMEKILGKKNKAGDGAFELSGRKFKNGRTLITRADLSDASAREYELLNVCDELEKISFDIIESQARINTLHASVREYEPYIELPIRLSLLGQHGQVTVAAYYCDKKEDASDVLEQYGCAYELMESFGGFVLVTVCRTGSDGEVSRALSALGYSRCAFTDDCTAEEKVSALEAECDDVFRHIMAMSKKALGYEKYYDDLRILYDVIETEIERTEADERFLKTDSTFILEGWIPESEVKSIIADVKKEVPDIFVQMLAPEERDEPPTLVVNSRVVKPYEDITNLYTPPRYREMDPNPIMSVFYFIFFGIMLGDAAYGLILAVLGFVFGLSNRFERGTKRLLLLVGMGGVSAVIWGIVFGGYFGIDFGATKVALWFNPLEDPMTMLIFSLVLGAVQLVAAYVMLFIKLCKEGKPFSAIFDAGSIILLFGALACLALTFVMDPAPKGLTTAAIVLAVAGLALIIIFGGRNSKNPIGKIFGGLKGVYGLINLLSDLLSYCRLFGLGLASCAIGLAFNTLGTLIMSAGGIGYVLGVVLLIILHIFNMGLGVLSAYVHDSRLQFLEFYGKFYDGGGRLFAPLGERSRYTRLAPPKKENGKNALAQAGAKM